MKKVDETQLPEGWINVELSNISEVTTGNTPPKKDKSNYGDNVPFVKPPELLNRTVKRTSDFLSEKGAKVGRVVPAQSVLVSCIGNLGKIGITDRPVAFNQQINAILPGEGFDPKFVFYQAQSPHFRNQLEDLSSATTVAIVNKGKFESVGINLPPLAEQHRIVAKIEELFSELDNGVAQLRQVQAQLKSYRQSVLKHAFEGKLTEAWRQQHGQLPNAQELLTAIQQERRSRHQQALKDWRQSVIQWTEAGKPGGTPLGKKPTKPKAPKELPPLTEEEIAKLPALPEEWRWMRLCNFADIIGGVTKGRKLEGKETVELPYLRVANVQDGYLNLKQIKYIEVLATDLEKYRLEYGDILYTEGGDKDKLGRGTIWRDQVPDCIHQNHVFRARTFKELTLPLYTAYYSQTPSAKDYFFRNAKQTVNLASINMTILSNLPVPLCSTEEQHQIVQEIESRLSVAEHLEKTIKESLHQAEVLRQSILQRAFTGQLVPQDPNDEPAAELLERIRAEKEGNPKKPTKAKTDSPADEQLSITF